MKCVVGLGNCGARYSTTRHNLGFQIVNHLALCNGLLFCNKSKFQAEIALGSVDQYKLLLVKPTTYMNFSGIAVQSICSYYKLETKDVFVIHDDIDLPLGKIKFKFGGGNGGHNGLKSIDQRLGNDYYRVRVGIGRPRDDIDVSEYVLTSFAGPEVELTLDAISFIGNNFESILSGALFNR